MVAAKEVWHFYTVATLLCKAGTASIAVSSHRALGDGSKIALALAQGHNTTDGQRDGLVHRGTSAIDSPPKGPPTNVPRALSRAL